MSPAIWLLFVRAPARRFCEATSMTRNLPACSVSVNDQLRNAQKKVRLRTNQTSQMVASDTVWSSPSVGLRWVMRRTRPSDLSTDEINRIAAEGRPLPLSEGARRKRNQLPYHSSPRGRARTGVQQRLHLSRARRRSNARDCTQGRWAKAFTASRPIGRLHMRKDAGGCRDHLLRSPDRTLMH